MLNTLTHLGASNVQVNGLCWSLTLRDGRRWAGGIGAVRKLIANGLQHESRINRDSVRLSTDAHGKTWTEANGG